MTGNDLIAVKVFYQNVWNTLRQVGTQLTSTIPDHDFIGSIRFKDNINTCIIVETPPANPLKLLSWPVRLVDPKKVAFGRGLDIFISIHQEIVPFDNDNIYKYLISKSVIRLYYCNAQIGVDEHNLEDYQPEIRESLHFDYCEEDKPFHPQFHMQFDNGRGLFPENARSDHRNSNIIPQIRVPTAPRDFLGVLWGLVSDHYSVILDKYHVSMRRVLSNSINTIPQMLTSRLIERLQRDNNSVYTYHWYPECDP